MSRRTQKLIVILCLAIIAVFIWYDRGRRHQVASRPNAAAVEVDDFQKYHDKMFVVVKVVDGDTLDVNIPDGKYKTTRIRLIGVDTPETKKPNTPVMYFGPEAYEFTRSKAFGSRVTVLLDTAAGKPRDRYGRLLAYIKLPNGAILNELLISEGYGYNYTPYKHSFSNKYRQLQNQAKSAKRGLWQYITPERMPKWMQNDIKKSQNKKAA